MIDSVVTIIIPIIFRAIPALIILGIFKRPEPNTMALGGVATGNIKAQLAAKVTGAAKIIGFIPISIAIAPITGKKVAVVAMLLVNSVRKIIMMAILITKSGRGNDPTEDKFDPIHPANPELLTAVARDKPPPKRIKMLHGRLLRCSHLSSKGSPLSPLGIMKSNIAPAIAMLESSRPLRKEILMSNGLRTHANAIIKKTIPTLISGFDMTPRSFFIILNDS